ncbi:hypothetical protein LMG29542_08042 [Paraburkholderia humisilvae]|uniref:Uncharacterized protein n=1 Tax=Paraburkholderia humisilvae TaxID=627669 RepID=A0A6J5F832_9BURK|nr:hypothetical protein LMG29542_08042 [Paraburkholderia humisilvae]
MKPEELENQLAQYLVQADLLVRNMGSGHDGSLPEKATSQSYTHLPARRR